MSQQNQNKKGGPRSAARLGAVQALYQLEMSDDPRPDVVIEEYAEHRLGKEIDDEQYTDADADLFADIVKGASERQEEIDEKVIPCLNEKWPFKRLERLIRAILRAGAYEILARPDVPTAVIINEYVDVAHAFYERKEANFVNGILDKLAREHRI